MQKNKILILIIMLFFTIGCKNNPEKQNASIVVDTSKVVKKEVLISKINDLEKISNKSFVISCGSGCAMTYTAEEIINNKSSIIVKFKVEMYIDEVSSDIYDETYNFIYKSNKIVRIELEGTKQNSLETLMPDAQQSFREFSIELEKTFMNN